MSDILIARTLNALRNAHSATPASAPSRRKRSIGEPSVLWRTGQILHIAFLGDVADEVKAAILRVAREWTHYANLEFKQADDNDAHAEIRIGISDDETQSYSVLGTESLAQPGPSMLLGYPPGHAKFERTVLHEFGHALGMLHEHQHPEANIPWDLDAIRKVITELLISEQIDPAQLSETLEAELAANFLPLPPDGLVTLRYDSQSIMHYAIQQRFTRGDFERDDNPSLSRKDKQFMCMAYPGRANACE